MIHQPIFTLSLIKTTSPLKVVEYDPDNEWSANAIVTCAADAFAVKVMVVVEFAFH
jgi:hypothetical protein